MELDDPYFQDLKDQGIVLTDAQKLWYCKKIAMLGDNIKAEFPSTIEEAFASKNDGYILGTYMQLVRSQKRIRHIPENDSIRVHTAWDLGFRDATSIIFFQLVAREIHIIDYIESSGKSMANYIKQVKNKDYIYGTHLAPHDIQHHEYTHGESRINVASRLGFPFTLVPNIAYQDGLDAVKNNFTRFVFANNDEVLQLVNRIENYRWEWDKTLAQWKGTPVHDAASHAADALRYLCVGLDYCQDGPQGITQTEADNLWRTHGRKL